MKTLLDLVNYNSFKWPLCADLKVLNTLLGLQLDTPIIPAYFAYGIAEIAKITICIENGLIVKLMLSENSMFAMNH